MHLLLNLTTILKSLSQYLNCNMTSQTRTVTLEEYVQVPETSENLDWADLVTLDLSDFDQPGGKQKLAAEFSRAIEDVGKRERAIIT